MKKEFDLSEKIIPIKEWLKPKGNLISTKKVKEFIRLLKEVLYNNSEDKFRDINMIVIDKLAGEKLC